MASVAELEADMISARTNSALVTRVQGRRPGYGYCRMNWLITRCLCSQSVKTLK
jgi:hypothetical protein